MAVMDDQDAGGFLFSYDKLLGGATLTKTDRDNAGQGKETSSIGHCDCSMKPFVAFGTRPFTGQLGLEEAEIQLGG